MEGQTPEELDAFYAPGSPYDVARRWIGSVLGDRDLPAAWPLMTQAFREELASSWVEANRNHPLLRGEDEPALTAALAQPNPGHVLWEAYCEVQLGEMLEAWSNVDLDSWGWASRPRLLGVDRELILLVDAGGEGQAVTIPGPMLLPSLGFLMERDADEWLVADVGDPSEIDGTN